MRSRGKLLYIGNQLSKHGFTPTSVETLGENLKVDYDVTQASSAKKPILRLFHIWYTVIRHRNADYLIIDTYSTSAFHFAWTSAKIAGFFGIKYIAVLRGGNLPDRLKKSTKRLSSFLRKADSVVCPSDFLKKAMHKTVDANYIIIPNYIDIEKYPFYLRHNFSPNILWVRSFDATYNPILAIRVLKKMLEKHPSTRLCMVGPDKDGSMLEVKKEVAKLGLEKNICITGKLSKRDWHELSKEYDIFLNTTNFDNTPVSVIEAMALGLVIVSTNVGGIPYLINKDKEGLLTPINDAESIVDAVEYLVNNNNKASLMTQNARKKVEKFKWEEVRVLWNEVLRDLNKP